MLAEAQHFVELLWCVGALRAKRVNPCRCKFSLTDEHRL